MLVVHALQPFKSVGEVVAMSKSDPSKWSYGTSGVGGPHHSSGEYFKSVNGAKLLHCNSTVRAFLCANLGQLS
jgi:tripartite-type tricarboxylate transporter receptor subunit TctC